MDEFEAQFLIFHYLPRAASAVTIEQTRTRDAVFEAACTYAVGIQRLPAYQR
ncbi:hypothetical protein LZK76_36760 (plasmid) [Rhizobium leguminosarum]|nr:hypothetical protein LZK76_36760 [Rhizobium leguminosarum]